MQDFEVLNIATKVGSMLILHGAEIYRVEESVRLICSAYGAEEVEVFAIPASIVVTISNHDRPMTKTIRTKAKDTDLDKVDQLNNLSRYICREKPSYEDAKKMISAIDAGKTYPLYVLVLASAFVAASFTLIFAGSFLDAAIAFLIGAVVQLAIKLMDKIHANFFFANIFYSAVIASLALLAERIGFADSADCIITGSLMLLVPGIALTNCIRDFISGDALAGLSRMVEVLLIATGIAGGVAIGFFFLAVF